MSDMLTPAADVMSRAMRSSSNYDYIYFVRRTRRQGVLSRCPVSLKSAAIKTEDDDVLDRNFQETPQNFFIYLILLLVLITA